MAIRGVEVLSDAPFPNLVDMGVFVVKVRTLNHLRLALDQVSAGWVGKIITRSTAEYRNLQPIADILNEAAAYYNEFRARNRLDRWLAHIPANEPNHPDGSVTAAQYQTYFANLTAEMQRQINATSITQIPATTPPLAPWERDEVGFVNAMKNATVGGTAALKLTDNWGNRIWRKYGCHHYWQNCAGIRYRLQHGMYYYASTLWSFTDKPIVVDECNSNPPGPPHNGEYPAGYNDLTRQRDLRFFTYLVETGAYHQTNTRVEAIVGFARARDADPNWHAFDYSNPLWANFCAFTHADFDQASERPC